MKITNIKHTGFATHEKQKILVFALRCNIFPSLLHNGMDAGVTGEYFFSQGEGLTGKVGEYNVLQLLREKNSLVSFFMSRVRIRVKVL